MEMLLAFAGIFFFFFKGMSLNHFRHNKQGPSPEIWLRNHRFWSLVEDRTEGGCCWCYVFVIIVGTHRLDCESRFSNLENGD